MKKAFTLIEFLVVVAIIAILLGLLLPAITHTKPTHTGSSVESEPSTVVFEGCEYFKNYNGHGLYFYTHKGNCTNNIHLYRR